MKSFLKKVLTPRGVRESSSRDPAEGSQPVTNGEGCAALPAVPCESPRKRPGVLDVQERLWREAVASHAHAREQEDLKTAIAQSLQDCERSARSTMDRDHASSSSSRPHRQTRERLQADERAMQKLSEIVANCFETNTQFVDPDFVPSLRVLYANGQCRRSEAVQLSVVQHFDRDQGNGIQWLRPGQILQRPDDLMMDFVSHQEMLHTMRQISQCVDWCVYHDDPNPMDISQGALGNCWFCGSLAAVAEKPALVKQLFVGSESSSQELSPVGAYLLRLCDGGEWQYVMVDDNLPCVRSCMLAYSGARRNQLWVPLVEKAFAKLRGCYEATEGGNPAEGLRLFTGWPSIVLRLQDEHSDERRQREDGSAMRLRATCAFIDDDLLWARLVSAGSAKLIMCGSCGHVDGMTRDMYRENGLSPSHCYSIVQVATARNGALRLLKFRNPWGTGLKWKGAFSDGDHVSWTDAVIAEVGATDLGQDAGTFWMTLPDVRRYFNSITICPYRDGWFERRISADFPPTFQGPQPAFLLQARSGSSTETLLSIMQPEERQAVTNMTADLGMVIFRLTSAEALNRLTSSAGLSGQGRSQLNFVDSIPRHVGDTSICDHVIEASSRYAGELVVPLSFNQRSPLGHVFEDRMGVKHFSFCCFSSREVSAELVELAPDIVRDAVVSHVKAHGEVGCRHVGVKLWKLVEAGLAVYLENVSMSFVEVTVALTRVLNVTVSRGVEPDDEGLAEMRSCDVVPPMHGMLVFVAAAMPSGHRYEFSAEFKLVSGNDSWRSPHQPPLAEPHDPLHSPFFLDGVSLPA
eukprot:TRINITY_DN12251_c0_g1_i2.p1 TRINITY_DN12251_c0_g1~~TRINITY_DN12251_c0_g1_i2.p1  ORF type:complete len:805 (-),score=65.93 TRINITY_DN12251_c0_g1_i2:130-2544(-)